MCSAFLPLVSGFAIRIRVRIRNPDLCPDSQSGSVSGFAIRIRVRIRNPDPYTDLQSGSVSGFAIRIRIRIHNPDLYPDLQSGSRYRRAKHLQNFVFWCSLVRAEGVSCSLELDILYGGLGIVKLHFFQLYWIRIQIHWIRIWIRIRKTVIDCDNILLQPWRTKNDEICVYNIVI
jgi:hypothetical protein